MIGSQAGRESVSKKLPLICSGHSRPVPEISYSPITQDGFFLVSACLDGKPMLRNGETGDWIGTFIGHKGAVWSIHLNSTATKAVSGSADYTAKIWDALTGTELETFTHKKILKTVHYSPDDSKIMTGGAEKVLRIFDLNKGEPSEISLAPHKESIKSCFWLDLNRVVSASQDELRLWDLRSQSSIAEYPYASLSSLELSSKYLCIANGREVIWRDRESFEVIKSFQLPIEASSASLAPNLATFVVGSPSDGWVRLYDFNTAKELELHKGHHGPVHCVRYAPDGATFASGSEDGTIRILQSESKAYGLWQEVDSNHSNNN